MNPDFVIVPVEVPVREAIRLLHRAGADAAPVVDARGCYVGLLSAADVLRWVESDCPEALVGPLSTCPYQARGRLVTDEEAVICVLAHGSCTMQAVQPATGGRHIDVCMRPAKGDSPFGAVPGYMTTDAVTVSPQTPLLDLVRQIVDATADRLVVLDSAGRPIGIVSAPDVLRHVHARGDG
jgi:CBS domain-containing protein